MSDTLGCGQNIAVITDRRGEQELLKLPKASTLGWGRTLNDISTGTLTVSADRCTPALDRIHPWAHQLAIYRRVGDGPGQRVWEGPIRRRRDTRDGLVLEARDVLGWAERRAIRTARKLHGSPLRTELEWSVAQAFAADDPNVTTYVQALGVVGPNIDRDIASWSAKHAEDITNLAGLGGRFTVVGRSVLLFTDAHTLGRTPVLTPENHLIADVEVIEDGDLLLTAVTSRDDNNRRATAGGVDSYYGLVEDVVSPGSGKHRLVALQRYAEHLRDQSYPTPVQLDIPEGATLRSDAPFPIELLVPGTMMPVETTTATGRRVKMTAVLSSVNVTQTGAADETVTITVVPVSQAVLA